MNALSRPPWVPTRANIERFAREVAEKFHPERIILFGSYAYGTPTDDSDVDIMVVMDTDETPPKAASRILAEVDRHFFLDLLVRRPRDIAAGLAAGDEFLAGVLQRGKVLYDQAVHH